MKKDWTLKKEKSHNFGYLSIQFKPLFGKQYNVADLKGETLKSAKMHKFKRSVMLNTIFQQSAYKLHAKETNMSNKCINKSVI